MTDQHAATYQAYLKAQAEANAAQGSSQPTLRNTPERSAPEAARMAALDDATAAAWDRHCAAVLSDPEPGAHPAPEPEPEAHI